MTKRASKWQATRVLAAVCAKYAEEIQHGWGEPKLYEPGFHAEGWTVAWESGPEGWLYAAQGLRGLWTEPVSHWCLAVFCDE